MSILLSVSGLSKYFGGVRALDAVDTDAGEGMIHGLIGPNGAGKTTFFNMVTGVDKASAGRIIFRGMEITSWPAFKRVKAGLARTFQRPQLFNNMTVLENVIAGTHPRFRCGALDAVIKSTRNAAEGRQAEAVAREKIDFVGLKGQEEVLCANLPYGRQRLAEIARALASDPALLLLDEPAAGLNSVERQQLKELIRNISKHTTILLVEHDMKLVMGICDHLTVLDFGKRIADDTPAVVQKNRAVVEAYLGKQVIDA